MKLEAGDIVRIWYLDDAGKRVRIARSIMIPAPEERALSRDELFWLDVFGHKLTQAPATGIYELVE